MPFGTVTDTRAAVAVQPKRLDGMAAALQPVGALVTDSPTRSKNVWLRATLNGIDSVVLPSTTGALVPGVRAKVPSDPIRETSSSGSWVESGSVEVRQFRLPR